MFLVRSKRGAEPCSPRPLGSLFRHFHATPTHPNSRQVDTGYPEIMRPSLYGAQHPLVVIPSLPAPRNCSYVVVGHTCESGDLLTPAPDDGSTVTVCPPAAGRA